MSKRSCPCLKNEMLYKNGQDFCDKEGVFGAFLNIVISHRKKTIVFNTSVLYNQKLSL